MSGETNEDATNVANDEAGSEDQAQASIIESLKDDVAELTAKLEKQVPIMDKLREHELSSLEREKAEKQKRKGVEGEIDALRESFSQQINDLAIDSALEKELAVADAMNVEVAKKLIDRSGIDVINGKANTQKISEIISNLKESESYLFKGKETPTKPNAPKPARAGEGENESIYKKEVEATKTRAELDVVLKKYAPTQ